MSNERGDYVINFPDSPRVDRDAISKSGSLPRMPSSRSESTSIGAGRIENSPVLSIIAYCLSSISMTVVNKYVVSGRAWNLTFLYLAIQAVVSTIAIIAAKRLRLTNALSPLDPAKARKWFPIAFLLVGMIYTGNKALQFLSVPVYTIFKNLTIIVIAYGEVLWFGSKVTPLALLSFGLMVLSSVVAAWDDQKTAAQVLNTNDSAIALSTLDLGYTWMGLNVLCSASFVLSMRKVIKKMQFSDWDTMFYNNLLTIPILVTCSFLTEDWSAVNLARNFPESSRNSIIVGMIYSGLAAILISYSSAWCIRVTSSTTYSMVGSLNKLPIAISGFLFFSAPVTAGGVLAIAIGFISGMVYTWARIK
ncbi:GDP-mannose transporter 1 [Colletotrichum truncatum]|uniref:GDP-mannose transporter 1 n=1 Tax=Colletotrichum truncatum TaxID=5467 RepID=A0ACC3Z511_COLTU|nr:GDP-mannose transporter 1 [Colletotrichum truncatum]KAF6795064.1 GDP-mannose transporter 1 [Colletotrichum truncatum]